MNGPELPHLRAAPLDAPQRRPRESLDALSELLRQRGITHLYGVSHRTLGVLSVAYGITVWSNGRILWWRAGDDETTWPAADAPGAARLLVELAGAPGPPR